MKFDLYYVDIGLYEITVNDMVCATSNSSIEGLIEELQNLYTNKNALLWPELNTIDYYYKTRSINHPTIINICQVEYATIKEFFTNLPCFYDKNERTITHLLTVEYPDTETFLKNFIKDAKINSPELLL